jgi:predicted CXXCH cytochrome family protein
VVQVAILRSVCIAMAIVGAAALASRATRAAEPPQFAGADACRKCHSAEHARWASSSHALGTRKAAPDSLPPEILGGENVVHAPGTTKFSRDGARFAAAVPFDDGATSPAGVDYVVGLRRMRMFVTRMPDGRHQVLPAMREEPGGVWFDYTQLLFGPGESAVTSAAPAVRPGEPSFWTGPERSFDARCARCHTSGYEFRAAPADARGARSSWRALGVDCEQCHGPASAHVAHWSGAEKPSGPDPLPRLASLPRERALDVCLACHLEAEPFSHGIAPGDDLLERVEPTLLDDDARLDATGRSLELVYEGVSFLASTCAAAGRLTCTDCHDAHGGANRNALVESTGRANGLCVRCHADVASDGTEHTHHAASGSAALCVNCHMPLVTIERGHGAVHDHTIGTPRPSADGRDACSWCHLGGRGAPADSPRLDAARIASSFREHWPDAERRPAWAATIAAGRAGREESGEALRSLADRRGVPRIVRASAARLLGRAGGEAASELVFLASDRDPLVRRSALAALGAIEGDDANRALLAGLSDTSPAVRSAAARAALAGFERVRDDPRLLAAVIPALEEDALAVPEDHVRWFRLGCARRIAGDERGALAAFERKLQLDPAALLVRKAVEEMRRRQPR